jgi:hypothetical protein
MLSADQQINNLAMYMALNRCGVSDYTINQNNNDKSKLLLQNCKCLHSNANHCSAIFIKEKKTYIKGS